MRQVRCLDLQVAEDGQYLGHRHLAAHLENIEETRDVLLDVKLDAKGLESHVLDPPHIRHLNVRGHFELCDALEESVHVGHVVVEDLLGRILLSTPKTMVRATTIGRLGQGMFTYSLGSAFAHPRTTNLSCFLHHLSHYWCLLSGNQPYKERV